MVFRYAQLGGGTRELHGAMVEVFACLIWFKSDKAQIQMEQWMRLTVVKACKASIYVIILFLHRSYS